MKLPANILSVVLCTAIAVTGQAPDSQQASNIEAPEAQPSGPLFGSKADTECERKCVGLFSYETEAEFNIAMKCLETCVLDIEAGVYLKNYDMLSARATPLSAASNSYGKDAYGKDGQGFKLQRDVLDADNLLAFAEKLEKTAWFDESDPNHGYRHLLEDIEKLESQFTLDTTDEMEGRGRKGNSDDVVKRTAALRDESPFESMPADECTEALSFGELLDRDSDSPSADEDEDESYAEFLSNMGETAEAISALWNTDKMYMVEVPVETGVSSEGSKQYWLYTNDGRKYGPYDHWA